MKRSIHNFAYTYIHTYAKHYSRTSGRMRTFHFRSAVEQTIPVGIFRSVERVCLEAPSLPVHAGGVDEGLGFMNVLTLPLRARLDNQPRGQWRFKRLTLYTKLHSLSYLQHQHNNGVIPNTIGKKGKVR